jgi:Ulp1 family protease
VGTEILARRESSASVIDISGDGNHVVTGHNMSSTSSTPKKTVQSVSSRSHHQNLPPVSRLGEVDEYNRTEAMIGFDTRKRRKVCDESERRNSFRIEMESGPRQRRTSLMSEPSTLVSKGIPPTSVNGVGKNPILIEDLERDEVVELSQAPKASQGRARKATPRPEPNKVSEMAEISKYFGKPKKGGTAQNGSPDTAVSSASSGSTAEVSEREEGGSAGNAVDEVQFLEEDSVDLVKSAADPVRVDQKAESSGARVKNNVMKPTKPKSKSLSEDGDIPRSAFLGVRTKKTQSPTSRMLKSELSFEITYMQSGQKGFDVNDACVPWKLQYDYDKNEFDIIANGESIHELYPSLVLKPEKIHVVKYCHDSLKVVISRAMEPSIGAAGQVLIGMKKLGDGNRLAQSLRKLNHTIKLSPLGRLVSPVLKTFTPNRSPLSCEHLDNIFTTTLKSIPLISEQPRDIALLTVKEARRAEEWSQPANVGRRRSSTAEQDSSIQTRRQSVVNRMQLNSLPDASVPSRILRVVLPARNELSSSSRLSTMEKEDFYGSRPVTRASSGQWDSERQFKLPKSRSPSPVRWTAEHPRWKEEHSWEASLTFPMEGKKKATVDARDIERLDEGEFLNDNLIAFYLRYLEDVLEKSRPELAQRIYFHNTFFYETLTKGKVRSNNINYEAVKRWTSKVDLFSYDYIVVPVCEKLHWYVAIICNAPRLLQTDVPEIPKSQDADEHAVLPVKVAPDPGFEEDNDDFEASKMLDSNEAAEPKSASPSVIAQVEQMSLEDQEWPEPDALPDVPRSGIAQLRSLQANREHNDNPIGKDDFENQGQNEDIRPKGKKPKRKSMPPARKYDPSDPRIITLDSLGQAHSPTCSNLREYLVCEAHARHNVEIAPGRLGMTAKGLPQQSNYCDCGVFVLGYIKKFLDNPDEFVYNILQGEMTENRASAIIGASRMRREIRELIFRLQAEQIRDEKRRRGAKTKAKKGSDTEPQPRVSSNLLGSNSKPARSKSTKVARPEIDSNSSNSSELNVQLAARSVTGNVRDGMRAKSPEARQPSSAAANGQEFGPVEDIEPHPIDTLRAKGSRHFSKGANTPATAAHESEIIETPALSVENEPVLAKGSMSRDKDHLSSPGNSREPSIQLDSPLHPDSMEGNWLKSPNRTAEAEFRTHNTFKAFAKSPDSPFQNTRYKSRIEKTSKHNPLEISDSQEDHQLEVRETPPRQTQHDDSFEDILELPTEPRKPKTFVLGGDHNLDPEVVSPNRILRRKGGARH